MRNLTENVELEIRIKVQILIQISNSTRFNGRICTIVSPQSRIWSNFDLIKFETANNVKKSFQRWKGKRDGTLSSNNKFELPLRGTRTLSC